MSLSLMQRTRRRTCQKHAVLCQLQPEDGREEEDTKSADIPSTTGLENEDSLALYGLIAGLATIGFTETAYLTYMKVFGGTISCPIGGGSCEDVLNSDYSMVFGNLLLGLIFNSCIMNFSYSRCMHSSWAGQIVNLGQQVT